MEKMITQDQRDLKKAQQEIEKLKKQKMMWKLAAIILGILFVLTLALKLALHI